MRSRGIGILYGRWLIEGAPRVLLIDTKTAYKYMDEWKTDLWNSAGIPSPPGDDETNEAIVFGYLVAWFLGEVSFPNIVPESARVKLTRRKVCLPREDQGCHCSLPRMVGWCSHSSVQEAPHRYYHHFHYPRHSARPIPLRRISRLLQQPAMV